MKAKLIKIKSNHNNISDEYEGVVGTLPKIGDRFSLFSPQTKNEVYKDHNKAWYILTTPVLSVNKLNDKVIEFTTKNSSYSLELVGE